MYSMKSEEHTMEPFLFGWLRGRSEQTRLLPHSDHIILGAESPESSQQSEPVRIDWCNYGCINGGLCFHHGRGMDLEPEHCRWIDRKKWHCSEDVVPN
ncbi:hypothetical protein Taro_051027 [Colocasia esculenta]|uniref:Uncharacterized protein n=1 Tax=Colocasia esculenta TaxID=4460 RepID=A0A843XFJ7_COLES|nr:hypothetical protein [Colocasia esculenta]